MTSALFKNKTVLHLLLACIAIVATFAYIRSKTLRPPSAFAPLSFMTLSSYTYVLPNAVEQGLQPPKDQIPQAIKELNSKKVAIQGFVVPIDLKAGKTTHFLLCKDIMLCCHGRMPRMNEWIHVQMKEGQGVTAVQDQIVTVFGDFEVGETIEDGEVSGIYRVKAEHVEGPPNAPVNATIFGFISDWVTSWTR